MIIKELIKLANELDAKGLRKEADALDEIISRANESNLVDPRGLMGESPIESPEYEAIMQRVEGKEKDGSMWMVALDASRGEESARERSVSVDADEGSKRTSMAYIQYMDNTLRTDGADVLSKTPWRGALDIYFKAGDGFGGEGKRGTAKEKVIHINTPEIPDNIKKIMSNALQGDYTPNF